MPNTIASSHVIVVTIQIEGGVYEAMDIDFPDVLIRLRYTT